LVGVPPPRAPTFPTTPTGDGPGSLHRPSTQPVNLKKRVPTSGLENRLPISSNYEIACARSSLHWCVRKLRYLGGFRWFCGVALSIPYQRVLAWLRYGLQYVWRSSVAAARSPVELDCRLGGADHQHAASLSHLDRLAINIHAYPRLRAPGPLPRPPSPLVLFPLLAAAISRSRQNGYPLCPSSPLTGLQMRWARELLWCSWSGRSVLGPPNGRRLLKPRHKRTTRS
jgi:hypothetical protein